MLLPATPVKPSRDLTDDLMRWAQIALAAVAVTAGVAVVLLSLWAVGVYLYVGSILM